MTTSERERRHQANLNRINRVQLVVGKGDRMRIDHEGTLLERARMMVQELASHRSTELGLAAFDRLLALAEEPGTLGRRDVADFILAVWGHQPLPLAALRGCEPQTGDDMLAVLDAYRYARLNLVEQVEGGAARVARVLKKWSLANA